MSTNPMEPTIDRLTATLRAELQAAFKSQAAEVAERMAAEHEAAIQQAEESARKQAQQQLLQAQQQLQQAQQAAEARLSAVRRELEQVRQTALDQVDAARRALQAETAARSRAEAQVEDVRRIGRTQVEEAQRMMGERLSTLTRELDQARRELSERRQELDNAHGVSAAALHDLVRGLHAVDESESLSSVFERLIESSRHHSHAASIYLVRNDDLTEWQSAGAERQSMRPDARSVASSAARERRRVESESALAFPLSVGGEVVAVLYAEVADALSPQRRMSKDALDVLTRHAGRVLETITIQQATGLRPVRKDTRLGLSDPLGERLS